jgi:hypothetical protein
MQTAILTFDGFIDILPALKHEDSLYRGSMSGTGSEL